MYGMYSVGIPIYTYLLRRHCRVYIKYWPYYGNGYIPQAGKGESLVDVMPKSARVM